MNRLEEIIKEKGLKKVYVASKIGKDTHTLKRYIDGTTYPDIKTSKKLSELLGFSIEELFFAKSTISVVNEKN